MRVIILSECPAENDSTPCSTPDPSSHHGNLTAANVQMVNNNMGNLSNLNIPSVNMAATSSSNNSFFYPVMAGRQGSYSHHGYQGYTPGDPYYPIQGTNIYDRRYLHGDSHSGLEYYQVDGPPRNVSTSTVSSHGNPPHYGLSLFPGKPVSLASECVSVHSTRTGSKLATPGGSCAKWTSPYHYPGVALPRHLTTSSNSGKCRQGVDCGSNRSSRVRPRPIPAQQWTSSESEAELQRTAKASHQVVLHHHDNSGSDVSPDSDSCSCQQLNSSNIDCSNRSTVGSSDVPSDVSSYDSNVYRRSRTPGEGGHTQNEGKGPPSPILPPTHLKPSCVTTRVRTRTQHAHSRKRSDSHTLQNRHSCHSTPNPVEVAKTVAPPMLKARHHRVTTKPAESAEVSPISSDQSISSLNTSGMSPIVSDWCQSSSSDSCEQISSTTLCNHGNCVGAVFLTQESPEFDRNCSESSCHGSGSCCQEASSDTSHCQHGSDSQILPGNLQGCSHDGERTHIIPEKLRSHITGNLSESDTLEPSLLPRSDSTPSLLTSVSEALSEQSSLYNVLALDNVTEKHDDHAPKKRVKGSVTQGCRTCASLRTSLTMMRMSMLHGDIADSVPASAPGHGIRKHPRDQSGPGSSEPNHRRATETPDISTSNSFSCRNSLVVFSEPKGESRFTYP